MEELEITTESMRHPSESRCDSLITFLIGLSSFTLLLFRGKYLFSILIVLYYVFFPFIFSIESFLHSKCLNKREIIDSHFNMEMVMKFEDSEKNLYVGEFFEKTNAVANVCLSVMSIITVLLGFM